MVVNGRNNTFKCYNMQENQEQGKKKKYRYYT